MEAKQVQFEKKTPKKKSLLKKILWAAGGIVLTLLILIAILPTIVSTSAGKEFILGKVNQAVDGKVEIETLSLGWFSGLQLKGVRYKDNAGTTAVSVDEIRLNPKISSLIKGQINLSDGLIDKPKVEIVVKPALEKPVSVVKEEPKKDHKERQAAALPLEKLGLELREGSAVITTAQPPQKLEFKNISTKVDINPAGQASTLNFALAVAGLSEPGDVKAVATVNPAEGFGLKGTSGNAQLELVNIKLEDFKPLLVLAGQTMDIAGLINAKADVKLVDGQFEKIAADAVIENFKQTADGKTTTLEKPVKINALAAMTDKGFRIDNLNVDSSFCNVSCKGDLQSLTYQAKADLAGVQAVAAQFTDMAGYKLAGMLNAAGSVNIKEQFIAAAGTADFENLAVVKGDMKLPPMPLKITYDVTQDGAAKLVKASSVDVVLDAGQIAVKDVSLPLDPQKMTQLSAKADIALNLQKALNLAKVFAAESLPKDLTVGGDLRSTLSITPEGSDIRFVTDKTEIKNLIVGQKGQTPFTQDALTLIADGAVNPTTKALTAAFNLEGKKAASVMRFKGNISQKPQKEMTALAGDVQAEYDWKDLTAMAKPFLPQGLQVDGKRNDKISFASTYPTAQPEKLKANLDADAALGFQSADFKGLKFGPTELKLNVKQGLAAIDIPDANVNDGKLRFSGDVNLASEPMKLTLRKPMTIVENVKIDDVISANLLQYLNPIFAKGSGISGTANLSCTTLAMPLGGGNVKDIDIAGNIGLMDVKANSPLLGIISAALKKDGMNLFSIPSSPFTVKNGLVEYNDMPVMFGKDFGLHFRGKIGLEDKALKMDVDVPMNGKTVTLPLTNTLDSPKLDVSRLVLSNISEQIPVKDEKTKEAVEKGFELLEGVLKGPKK